MNPLTALWPARRGERAPDALPILGKGAHRRPQDGACVMEYVSVLAGTRFTDRPRCTHPALATLARLVNDEINNNEVRNELATLAPDLAGIGWQDSRVAPIVIATCLRAATMVAAANSTAAESPRLQLAHVERRIDLLRTNAWLGRWARCAQVCNVGVFGTEGVRLAFQLFHEQVAALDPEERDVLLYLLLVGAVSRCRRWARPDHAMAPS